MTSFGLETFAASGRVGLSTKDTAWSLVGYFAARPGITTEVNYPAAAGMELDTFQLQMDFIPDNQEAYVSGTTVTGNTVHVDASGTVNSLVMVFAR